MNDTHNPYTPPSAAVQDVRFVERHARPVAVVIAVALLVVGLLYDGVAAVRLARYIGTGFVAPTFFVWSLGRWIVLALACAYLWRGRNWGRILLLALTALSLYTLFRQIWSFTHQPAGMNLPLGPVTVSMLVVPLIDLAALFLVYVPGRAWFGRGAAG